MGEMLCSGCVICGDVPTERCVTGDLRISTGEWAYVVRIREMFRRIEIDIENVEFGIVVKCNSDRRLCIGCY